MSSSSSFGHDVASAAAPGAAPVAAFATLQLPKLWTDAEAALLQAADVTSVTLLMELADTQLVAALWKLCPPLPLPSTRPPHPTPPAASQTSQLRSYGRARSPPRGAC